jgi:uncharacterized membrane protein
MQVPFEGFVVPSLFQLAVLVAGTVAIAAMLYTLRPPVTQKVVLTFAPWMVSGAALHVFFQLGEAYDAQVYPRSVEPLFSAPAVYLTTFVVMGVVWVAAVIVRRVTASATEGYDYVARYLGSVGAGVMLVLVGLLLWQATDPLVGPLDPVLPTVGLIAALVLTFLAYVAIGVWRTYVIAEARYVAALVLFAHAFDGVTTAIGVDLIGVGERSALPARIIEFSATLPTAQYLGSGWLFVVVKMLVAASVVVLFADYAAAKPNRANLLYGLVAAVGLGPAANNYLLFMLGLGG